MMIKVALAASLGAALTLASPSAHAVDGNELVVMQDVPILAAEPDSKPNTLGATLYFGADLRDAEGKKIGELIGRVTTVDVLLDGVEEEDRFRELVFNMRKGQIVVLGASQYVAAESHDFANDNAPVTAVIVGGTGDCVGVRGAVKTTKRKNGTFIHSFRFVE